MKPPNQYHPRERKGGTQVCINFKVLPSSKCWWEKRQVWAKPEARKSSSHWGGLSATSQLLLLVPPWLGGERAEESKSVHYVRLRWWVQIGKKIEILQGFLWSPGLWAGQFTQEEDLHFRSFIATAVSELTLKLRETVSVNTAVKHSREGLHRALQPN